MFYLHTSNRTENLLRQLAAVIEIDPKSSLFTSENILVQSQGMEKMITQYLADYFGSWCNYTFFLPVTFLQEIGLLLGIDITPDVYERELLVWRIEEKLRDYADRDFSSLNHYLSDDDVEVKRFQLARKVADVFDQYQLMRPSMIKKWENREVTGIDDTELWQLDLWNQLAGEGKRFKHRGELILEVISKLKSAEHLSRIPKRVSVFGINSMTPIFFEYIYTLARHCDIHFFWLNPCKSYWADMEKDGCVDHSHPLLTSLGKQGREFQRLLLQYDAFQNEFSSYENPEHKENTCLLHTVQADLLKGEISKRKRFYPEDKSIRIVSCYTRKRELEVLKDHIIHLLDHDHELELKDVVVMAPDIQLYSPFIPSVFENIQHSVADRSSSKKNAYIALFQEFLELLHGEFGWAEVMDYLCRDEVAPSFYLSHDDCLQLQEWVVASGIRWGLSDQMKKGGDQSIHENSWKSGIERMFLGYAVSSEDTIHDLLPFGDVEGNAAYSLGGLAEFINFLENTVRKVRDSHVLTCWSDILVETAEKLFEQKDDNDYLDLITQLRELQRFGQYNRKDISLSAISMWFESSTRERRSASGFLQGVLTFCSLLPMRSIPFKAVCLIGMNYGEFPKNDSRPIFDLMVIKPQPGDRSVRADDRYQFLEALLSARESLYLSFLGRSVKTNTHQPPSVVISEFLDMMEKSYGREDGVEYHPLHAFSKRYFVNNREFFSYDEKCLQLAKKLTGSRTTESPSWWSGNLEQEVREIDYSNLLSFYSHPQRFFLQSVLGVQMQRKIELPDEAETFELHGLGKYLVDQEIVHRCLLGETNQGIRTYLQQYGKWPLSNVGELIYSEKKEEVEQFVSKIEEISLGRKRADHDFSLEYDDCKVSGKLSGLYENGMLLYRYAPLTGKDLVKGWICHCFGQECFGSDLRSYIVMKDIVICFQGDSAKEPALHEIIGLYREGNRRPIPFFIEPAFAYCKQKSSSSTRITPVEKAKRSFYHSLEKGYDQAWQLLYGSTEISEKQWQEFGSLSEKIMYPLWSTT